MLFYQIMCLLTSSHLKNLAKSQMALVVAFTFAAYHYSLLVSWDVHLSTVNL